MLGFAMETCLASAALGEADFAALHGHGFSEENARDIAAITALFGLSNRTANATSMRPNRDPYLMSGVTRPPPQMRANRADDLIATEGPAWAARLAISNHGLRTAGGIERYAMTITAGLHECGIRPTFIAKSFDTSLPEYRSVRPVQTSVRAAPGKLRDLLFDWRIGRVKRRLDLYPLIGCNQTRWSDIGICGSTHPGFLGAMGQRVAFNDLLKIALERAHLQNSQVIVAHSARMRDEVVRHYGIASSKIRLLYPPVDGARFSAVDTPTRETLRRQLDLQDDRAVFLLASTGHRRKGLDLLLDFFSRTDLPATLVIAGRAMPGTARNVRHLGYRSDIENIYRAVDFTVMASLYEPFGLVGIESVLCGTPVLLAEGAGCAEVIRDPAQLPFAPSPRSLETAVVAAVERWRRGGHRLAAPREHLAYDPAVSVHVDALLAIVRSLHRG